MIIAKNDTVHPSSRSQTWTLASKFVKFMAIICFIPVSTDDEKTNFKIWKVLVYILLFPASTLTANILLYTLREKDELNGIFTSRQSIFDGIGSLLLGISICAGFCLPISLGHGLQKMRSQELFKNNLFFPSKLLKFFSGNKKFVLHFV